MGNWCWINIHLVCCRWEVLMENCWLRDGILLKHRYTVYPIEYRHCFVILSWYHFGIENCLVMFERRVTNHKWNFEQTKTAQLVCAKFPCDSTDMEENLNNSISIKFWIWSIRFCWWNEYWFHQHFIFHPCICMIHGICMEVEYQWYYGELVVN